MNTKNQKNEVLNIEQARKEFNQKKNMITGETIFFLISIITGAILIFRASRERVRLANRQNNFILAVSHELKSPLTTIQMVLETFRRKYPDEQQRKLLIQSALEENNRLSKLVDNLLVAARNNEEITPLLEKLDLHSILLSIIRKFEATYPTLIIQSHDHASNHFISGSVDDVHLIINNILENSIKYAGIEQAIEIAVNSDNTHCFLTISDRGPGVPKEERKNIFKLFYRIGSEESRKSQGTGLGLYIALNSARKMNAEIELSDNKPQGSIFTIRFKLAK